LLNKTLKRLCKNRHFISEALNACLPYYCKSFPYNVTPVQNVNSYTGALMFCSTRSGATTNFSSAFNYPMTMRISPTMTFYNPDIDDYQHHKIKKQRINNKSDSVKILKNNSFSIDYLDEYPPPLETDFYAFRGMIQENPLINEHLNQIKNHVHKKFKESCANIS